jgi:hypothetical protein
VARRLTVALALTCALAGCGGSGHSRVRSEHRQDTRPCRDYRFDSARWRSARSARAGLAQDLVRCRALAGLSPGRVLRLLGPPDGDFHEGFVTYTLATGPRRLELVVAFDSSHHVDRVRITRV